MQIAYFEYGGLLSLDPFRKGHGCSEMNSKLNHGDRLVRVGNIKGGLRLIGVNMRPSLKALFGKLLSGIWESTVDILWGNDV